MQSNEPMLLLTLLVLGSLYLSRGVPILQGKLPLRPGTERPGAVAAIGWTLTALGLMLLAGAAFLLLRLLARPH